MESVGDREKWLVLAVASGLRQISLKSDLSLTFLQILHYFYSIVLVRICFNIKKNNNILTYSLLTQPFAQSRMDALAMGGHLSPVFREPSDGHQLPVRSRGSREEQWYLRRCPQANRTLARMII